MKEQAEKYNLPEGWMNVSLGDILILEYGKSLPKNSRQDGKYPIFGSNGIIGYHNDFLVEGPVIIIGRKGSVGSVHISNENCWPIDTTYYIKPTPSLNFKFVFFILKFLNLSKLDKSTTIPGLNRDNVYEQIIELPPLDQQNRIVLKLEEIFSGLEKSKEQLEKVLDQLNIYKKTILRNAFEEKLTGGVRNYSASSEEDLVYAEQNKRIDRRWTLKELHEVAKIIMGQSPPGITYNSNGIGIPLINGPVEFGPTPFSKTVLSKWTTSPTKLCQEGDLIVCVRGSTTGRQNIAGFDACIGRGVAAIRAINVNQKYVNHYINYSREKIFSMGTGTTFPNVSHEQLSKFPIYIFSLEEQEKIVNEIEYRFTISDSLFTTINNSIRHIEAFKYSTIQKALKGKLLEQHSHDEHEPASILLERIKVEKEEYLAREKEKKNNSIKIKIMPEELKSILEILNENTEPISSKQLWLSSDKKDDIEEFYAELKKHIESGDIIELPRNGKESFLKLADKS